MSMIVSIQLDGSFAVYEVNHETDGIYEAKLVRKSYHIVYNYPEKVLLSRSGNDWISDQDLKEVGVMIGHKIDKQEKPE